MYTWSFPITLPKQEAIALVKKDGASAVTLKETDTLFRISANGVHLSFSKKTGMLREVRNEKGIIPFTNGPVVQEGATNFKKISHRMEDGNLIIESSFDRKEASNTLQWTV